MTANPVLKVVIGVILSVGAITLHYYWKTLIGLSKLLKMILAMKIMMPWHAHTHYSFTDELESQVDRSPHTLQLIQAETGEKRTLKQVDELANQVAHWAKEIGLKEHDVVSLMMPNNLDYVPIWYGLSKIGVCSALLNTSIAGRAFYHCIDAVSTNSEVKLIIVDNELQEKLQQEVKEMKSKGYQVAIWGEKSVMDTVRRYPTSRPARDLRKNIKEKDPLLFIYTSGTTGLPKACKISHSRYWLASLPVAELLELKRGSVLYTPLPLYHSAAGLMAVGGVIRTGATLVIRKKFSASNFTKDCLQYGVTAVQYIGELCRYLVNLSPNPEDDKLKIQYAYGNGMNREYWTKFQERYHVKHVVEFYGATEGNVALFNCFDAVGPLGYIPRWLDFIYPLKLIKTDPNDQTMPLRDEQGRCVLCAANEPGLLIAEISADRRFEGYTDPNATKAKIFRDVFKKGDAFFNTGDLLSRDEAGYFYWCDRIGDTFRWKGENVSTTEVSQVISACSSVEDCVVYGVEVPNADGRAGMTAIVLKDGEGEGDGWKEQIETECSKNLPVYARPLFIRLKRDGKLPTTATHKYVTRDLVKEGFDPKNVGADRLFLLDQKTGKYQVLSEDSHNKIVNGSIRL